MSNTKNKNCILYCRVSTAKSAQEGESLDTQDGILRKFVGDKGWAVVPNGKVLLIGSPTIEEAYLFMMVHSPNP